MFSDDKEKNNVVERGAAGSSGSSSAAGTNSAASVNGAAETKTSAPKSEADELKEKLLKCGQEKEEYLAGWKRAKADFINYKKDELKRMDEIAKYANESLFDDLISALDNFDIGLRALEKAGPVERGVYMIRAQIEDILQKRGLVKISIQRGSKFDPAVAEAVAEVESEDPAGVVVEEIAPGYRLYDKIIRPAKVKVGKGQRK
jgi:molecular chaperone GrpE